MTGRKFLAGGVAGLVAGLPMTGVMEFFFRLLPRPEQYPLPPREITEVVVDRVDADPLETEPELTLATLAAHFGYSAAAGAAYSLAAPRLPRPLIVKGLFSGLGLWALGYLGWLPALGILRPATQHPPRRTALMIAAHLVWGWTAALAYRRLGGE